MRSRPLAGIGVIWRPPTSLPKPNSVFLEDIREPQLSSFPKVAAVLTDPAHPLFMRCAYITATTTTAVGMCTPTGLLPILTRAIDALPAGFPPRQAGIVASLLAFALMRWEDKTGQLPQGQELARTLQQLVHHGILNPTTVEPVTLQELDGERFLELFEEPTSCFPGDALPECWGTPRCVTLAGLCMNSMVSSVSGQVFQQMAAGVPRQLWTGPLLEELLDAAVCSYSGCMIAHATLWLVWQPGATDWLQRALLQRRELLERWLMSVPDRLLAAVEAVASSTAATKDRVLRVKHIHLWALQLVRMYTTVFADRLHPASRSDPPRQPAPLFLVRLMDALLALYRDGDSLPWTANLHSRSESGVRQQGVLRVGSSDPALETLRQDLFAHQSRVAPGVGVGLALAEALKDVLQTEEVFKVAVADGVALRMLELAIKLKDAGLALALPVTYNMMLAAHSMCDRDTQPRPAGLQAGLWGAACAPALDSPQAAAYKALQAQVGRAIEFGQSELLDDVLKGACPKKLREFLGCFIIGSLPPGTAISSQALTPILSDVVVPAIIEHGRIRFCYMGCRKLAACVFKECQEVLVAEAWASVESATSVQDMLLQVLQEAWIFQQTDACKPALTALADLVAPGCKLPKAQRLQFQKEVLWRVGNAVQDICARYSIDGVGTGSSLDLLLPVPRESMWRFVASMANHQMTGEQLQRLHETMLAKRYQPLQDAKELDAFIQQCWAGDTAAQSHTGKSTNDLMLEFFTPFLSHAISNGISDVPGGPEALSSNFLQPATCALISLASQPPAGPPSCSPSLVVKAAVSVVLAREELLGSCPLPRRALWPGPVGRVEEAHMLQLLEAKNNICDSLAGLAWLALLLRGAELKEVQWLLGSRRLWAGVRNIAGADSDAGRVAGALMRDMGAYRAAGGGSLQAAAEGGKGDGDRWWGWFRGLGRSSGPSDGGDVKAVGPSERQAARQLPMDLESVRVLRGCWWRAAGGAVNGNQGPKEGVGAGLQGVGERSREVAGSSGGVHREGSVEWVGSSLSEVQHARDNTEARSNTQLLSGSSSSSSSGEAGCGAAGDDAGHGGQAGSGAAAGGGPATGAGNSGGLAGGAAAGGDARTSASSSRLAGSGAAGFETTSVVVSRGIVSSSVAGHEATAGVVAQQSSVSTASGAMAGVQHGGSSAAVSAFEARTASARMSSGAGQCASLQQGGAPPRDGAGALDGDDTGSAKMQRVGSAPHDGAGALAGLKTGSAKMQRVRSDPLSGAGASEGLKAVSTKTQRVGSDRLGRAGASEGLEAGGSSAIKAKKKKVARMGRGLEACSRGAAEVQHVGSTGGEAGAGTKVQRALVEPQMAGRASQVQRAGCSSRAGAGAPEVQRMVRRSEGGAETKGQRVVRRSGGGGEAEGQHIGGAAGGPAQACLGAPEAWRVDEDAALGPSAAAQLDGSITRESAGDEVRQCSVCGAQPPQMHLCSRCQAVRYCGVECQLADWKSHKKVCKLLQVPVAASGATPCPG